MVCGLYSTYEFGGKFLNVLSEWVWDTASGYRVYFSLGAGGIAIAHSDIADNVKDLVYCARFLQECT